MPLREIAKTIPEEPAEKIKTQYDIQRDETLINILWLKPITPDIFFSAGYKYSGKTPQKPERVSIYFMDMSKAQDKQNWKSAPEALVQYGGKKQKYPFEFVKPGEQGPSSWFYIRIPPEDFIQMSQVDTLQIRIGDFDTYTLPKELMTQLAALAKTIPAKE